MRPPPRNRPIIHRLDGLNARLPLLEPLKEGAMFTHDWFHGPGFQEQQDEARWRCAISHFPDVPEEERLEHEGMRKLAGELDLRMLVYLRDGFSYEVKDIADVPSKSHLVFECVPMDEHYKVGAFVVSLPYEEIVRVEVFAVHPKEKPEEYPMITGFRSSPDQRDLIPGLGNAPPKTPRTNEAQ